MLYRCLLLMKLCSVLAFAGACVAAFAAESLEARKAAVHRFASPALLAVWAFGYLLTLQLHIAFTELWILGGLIFSMVSQLALVRSAATDDRSLALQLWVAVPLFLTLALMVFRPTWREWLP